MSGDTADLIERAAKRKDALGAARLAALDGDYDPARELARIEEEEAADAADLADAIGKAKTGRELAKLAPPADVLAALPFGAPLPAPVLWRDTGDPDATPERCGTVLCAGEVGMLAGPGEAGKSTVAVALTRAAREGGAACGLHVARGRVAVLSYEDSGPRLADRFTWYGPPNEWAARSAGARRAPAVGSRPRGPARFRPLDILAAVVDGRAGMGCAVRCDRPGQRGGRRNQSKRRRGGAGVPARGLDADSFDSVPANGSSAPVIDLRRAGVSVSHEVLNVLDGDALGEKVGDDHRPEAVGCDDGREPGVPEPPLEHRPDRPRRHRAIREALGGELKGPEERPGRVKLSGREEEVSVDPAVQVHADGDLADKPPLLMET